MNILFVDQYSELGGAQQCLLDLMPAILERGWQAHVAAPGDGPLIDSLRAMGIPCHRTPLHLRRLVSRLSIDLVYVNGPRLLPAATCCGRPVIFHAHSVPQDRYARTLAGIALRTTQAEVIAVSEYAAASWRRFVPDSRIRVIYNGVPDYGVRQSRCPGPFRIGMVGRIAREKGHLDFVQAARMVGHSKFVICGAPLFSDANYAEQIRAEARGAPVEFMGWQADIGPVLHSLDILAVPSAAHDAAPRVILEAFSAGVPVVAYPSGGIPELASDGGVVVTQTLAETIVGLLADPERMHALSIAGRRAWARRFRLESYRENIVALLSTRQNSKAATTASTAAPTSMGG